VSGGEVLAVVGVVLAWALLQWIVLPRLGVPT
jgi:hypothetical protein